MNHRIAGFASIQHAYARRGDLMNDLLAACACVLSTVVTAVLFASCSAWVVDALGPYAVEAIAAAQQLPLTTAAPIATAEAHGVDRFNR